jgi:hypothetical protein
MLPDLFPGLDGASPLYAAMKSLPASGLATLTKRGSDQGPSDFTNELADVYEGFEKGNLPSFDRLVGNMARPGKGLEQMFQGTPIGQADAGVMESTLSPGYAYGEEPLSASEATYTFAPLLDAATAMLPSLTAAGTGSQGYGGYLMDKWGSKALRKDAGKGTSLPAYVGKRLMR